MLLEKPLIQILGIILVGICIYANSVNVPFTYDDGDYVVNNPAIKDFTFFLNHAKLADLPVLQDVKYNFVLRPVAYLTFALNYHFNGLDLHSYHMVNILIHIANALLLYRFFGLTLNTPLMAESWYGSATRSRVIKFFPLFAALLFVAHPLQTQAVTYIVQRFVSLAAFFILGTLVLYVEARLTEKESRRRWLYAASFISALLAMKTKENAFTLPILLLLYEFMFLTGALKRRMLRLLPYLATMAIIPWTVISLSTGRNPAGAVKISDPTNLVNFDSVSRWDYLMTQFGAVAMYVRLLLFPVRQNFYHDYPVVHEFWSAGVLLPLLFLVVLLGSALLLWRRAVTQKNRAPWSLLIAFGILWFFVALSVESSLIPMEDALVEHRVYLPSVGFFLVLCGGIGFLNGRCRFCSTRMVWVGMLTVVALLCVSTVSRNTVWASNVVLWQDVVRKSPNTYRAYDHLGFSLVKEGRNEEAVAVLRKGIELSPGNFKLHMHLGAALINLGRFEEATLIFQQASAISPENSQAYANLAISCFKMGDVPAGRLAMEQAVALNPGVAGELLKGMGIALLNRNQSGEALAVLLQSLAVAPNDPQTHNNVATAYLMRGDVSSGRASLLKAVELDPYYGPAHYNLGCLLEREGKFAEALAEMQKALRSNSADSLLQERVVKLRLAIEQQKSP